MGILDNLLGSNSKPNIQSVFSQDVEEVRELLQESIVNTNIEQSTESSATNKATISGIKATGKDSKVNISLEQRALAQASQDVRNTLDNIIKADVSSDVKLDALLSVSDSVVNDGALLSSTSAADKTKIDYKKDSKTEIINKLNTSLRNIAAACAANEIIISGVEAAYGGNIDIICKQEADSISDSLQQIANTTDGSLTQEEKDEITADITKSMEIEDKGIVAGVYDNVADTLQNATDKLADTAQNTTNRLADTVQNASNNLTETGKSFFGSFKYIAIIVVVIGIVALIVLGIGAFIYMKFVKKTVMPFAGGRYYDY